jgi:hypothetical protein
MVKCADRDTNLIMDSSANGISVCVFYSSTFCEVRSGWLKESTRLGAMSEALSTWPQDADS